ncbi:MAG TPA: 5-formyltetrahydrofolate cyclo-ligase [Egibacteraceae bacterium]|nr:5-formyltetrahydrofolate cyclo-ligase [Egibacteraceae bacterium]
MARVPRDHSADAGGDPAVLDAKRALREEVWDALAASGAARFPGARHRIPNFTGAEAAAQRLRATEAWRRARVVKANPDSPQWPVRQRALEDGLLLAMAVPRLAEPEPFFLLDPGELDGGYRAASSIKGASAHARTVAVAELEPFDLIVTGCVAVDRSGARLGKGGGFADLEFGLLAEAGLVGPSTVVATTVHPVQVLEPGRIPMGAHDAPLDLVVTPDEVIVCDGGRARPDGIAWDQLTREKIDAIPLLRALCPTDSPAGDHAKR